MERGSTLQRFPKQTVSNRQHYTSDTLSKVCSLRYRDKNFMALADEVRVKAISYCYRAHCVEGIRTHQRNGCGYRHPTQRCAIQVFGSNHR